MRGDDPLLDELEADISGFVMVPLPGSPVRGPDPQRVLPGRAARPAARPVSCSTRTSTGTASSTATRSGRCATPADRATSGRSRRPCPTADGDRLRRPAPDAVEPAERRGPGSVVAAGEPDRACRPAAPRPRAPGAGPARAEAGAARPPRPALRRTARLHPPLPGPPARRRPAPLGVPLRRARRHRRGPPPRPRARARGDHRGWDLLRMSTTRRCLSAARRPERHRRGRPDAARRRGRPRSPVAVAAPAGAPRRRGSTPGPRGSTTGSPA